uniref:G-type lectin S-receptor-like serine/threonine-protein kinase At4g27290 n=1 Tax=Tanacetum cinerariifolium TaxID=118510 RepID=A0A6L2JQ73_TANCI|nr:G-type lectin S-receptor-like serine/threonine-protein kinase At4g27290 [Tanacetum cinerariifolium]
MSAYFKFFLMDVCFNTDKSSAASGGRGKGLFNVDSITAGDVEATSFGLTRNPAESFGLHRPNVYRLCCPEEKKAGVQKRCGKRHITDQRVPGHTTVAEVVGSSGAQAKGVSPLYIDIGDCQWSWEHCNAKFWYNERLKGYSKDQQVRYQKCCSGGKVTLKEERADTISINQTLRDGETIVSAQESFELGFFSPSNTSKNRYLGTWYKKFATGTIVWVANRETPISNKTGELTLNPGGLLVLRDNASNRIIWSSNTSTDTKNVVARLLDTSNFMVVDSEAGPENYIWQSFDHPANTMMPNMKLGRNLERGLITNFTSWKSDDDPSQGQYMICMDFSGLPQVYQKNGDKIEYRLGSWNGLAYSGSTSNHPNPIYQSFFYMDENQISAVIILRNKSVLSRLTLSSEGNMEQWNWITGTQGWLLYSSLTTDMCERYALCGVHGICDIRQSPICGCLRGFTPKRPDQWEISDWSSGCQREMPLDCGVGEGFRKYSFVKLPDTRQSWFDRNMTMEQCNVKCKNECNCTAYATLDIEQGIGCLIWYNEFIDMRILPGNGQDIYIRMSAVELEKDTRGSGRKTIVRAIVIPATLGFVILLGLCILIIMKKKKAKAQGLESDNQ